MDQSISHGWLSIEMFFKLWVVLRMDLLLLLTHRLLLLIIPLHSRIFPILRLPLTHTLPLFTVLSRVAEIRLRRALSVNRSGVTAVELIRSARLTANGKLQQQKKKKKKKALKTIFIPIN